MEQLTTEQLTARAGQLEADITSFRKAANSDAADAMVTREVATYRARFDHRGGNTATDAALTQVERAERDAYDRWLREKLTAIDAAERDVWNVTQTALAEAAECPRDPNIAAGKGEARILAEMLSNT